MATDQKPSFFARLKSRINHCNSLLCVGLDPHVSQLPEPSAKAAEKFCVDLINATFEVAAAYKPNAAFFEAFGAEGMAALKNVISAVPDSIPVLLDAKRGDISTTAAAYATAAFDALGSDAITLAPYMGQDSIEPFIGGHPERGCFVLCKTSNNSADELQTLKCAGGLMLYEKVALLAEKWNSLDNLGVVVGATDLEALRKVRAIAPNMWILAPGIGAQGGDLEEATKAGLSDDGMGLLIPISRAISKSDNPRAAAIEFRDAINVVRAQKQARSVTTQGHDFITFAKDCGVLRFGEFTLKSGRQSPYFFNAGLFSSGRALAKLGRFYAKAIHDSGVEFDVIFGPAYKGITLAAAVSIAFADMYDRDVPFTYNRKEAKDHGEGGVLVGASMDGKRVLIIDDVITAGTAIREAMDILKGAGGIASGVCISLDRQEKAPNGDGLSAIQQVEKSYSIPVISIARLVDLISYLEMSKSCDAECLQRICEYRSKFGIN